MVMSPASLVAGYKAYTDIEELRQEIARGTSSAAEPTTTVLTTSINCGQE
jgi:hypothetical protein